MHVFSLWKSNRANLNPTTSWQLATAMQGSQAPCRRMHSRGPLPESGRFVQTPRTPPAYGPESVVVQCSAWNLSSYIGYVVNTLYRKLPHWKQPHLRGRHCNWYTAPTCTWKLDVDFDDMAFAHMLKYYSVLSFPGLVMQFRTVFFFSFFLMLLFTGSYVLKEW